MRKLPRIMTGWLMMGLVLGWLSGCSSSSGLSTTQELKIEMYGVNVAPEGAAGDITPKWQSYTLTGVTFTSEDGSEVSTLYDGTDPQTYRIVNRAQLIYTKDITDLAGTTFSDATITFEAAVTGGSSESEDHSFTLSAPSLSVGVPFTIDEGKNRTLVIQIQWKNTVSGETMSEPSFSITPE